MTSTRQLAAIMFTDIVGYTSLMGSDESKAFLVLKSNRKIHKRLIKKYGGKWLKEMRDGTLASFKTISEAVYCAGELIRASTDEKIYLRIGIHFGEITVDKGDIFGDGVNVASRIELLAKPGQILVSGSMKRNVKNLQGIKSTFLEEKQLKNVDEPIRIYQIEVEIDQEINKPVRFAFPLKNAIYSLLLIFVLGTTISILVEVKNSDQTTNINKSIVVLPFKDMSTQHDQENLGDGIAEEIINKLTSARGLKVIGRTSSFLLKTKKLI